MIVYAGKQYWNDFNNWDEALFQDANRPRDNDKFKLKPWLQSDKWDWRWTTKNTDFSHAMIKGFCRAYGTPTWPQYPVVRTVPTLKEKRTDSELSAISAYSLGTEYWQMEKENNPFVIVKSWNITYSSWNGSTWTTTKTANTSYFEISKSWLYSITVSGTFYFDTNYYSSTYGYEYKERVWLAQPINWVFTTTDRTQSRSVWNGDNVRLMQIWWYPQGSQLVPLVAHSVTNGTNYVVSTLSVVRLW